MLSKTFRPLRLLARQSVRRTPALLACQRAYFSVDYAALEKGINKLNKALDKEIAYEEENYAQLEDIDTFLEESGFKYTEEDDGINLLLTKEVGDKLVEVKFEARAPLPEEELPQQEEMEGQEDYPSENYCDFSVFVSDKNTGSCVVVECTSMDTEISFSNMLVCDDVKKVKELGRFERTMELYPGPEFSTLDERIQTALVEYLNGVGINEHLAAFVECMSLDKDQRLYMSWLGKLKDFVNE